jgi:hypothetical protein
MSIFIDEINKHQEEIRRLSEQQGTEMTYEMMRVAGLVKVYTFRVPVHTLAQLDYLMKFGPWSSKQEMLYSLINSGIQEFINSPDTSESIRAEFRRIAEQAFLEHRSEAADEEAPQ